MSEPDFPQLSRECHRLRQTVLEMAHKAGSGHCGGSFSAAEIMWVLFRHVLRHRPEDPRWPDRDRFVLSKGHAAPMLYAVLAERGYFGRAELMTLRQTGSILQGHPCMTKTPGVEISTGSLGMGISAGLGMALGYRLAGRKGRIYVLVGDGELQEGQNWEALMAASKFAADNLIVIVDHNRVQLDGRTDEIMPLGDLEAKLRAFGWEVGSCDGHDCRSVLQSLRWAGEAAGRPRAIVANTIKGKGVSFMEGQSAWHGKPVLADDFAKAKAELATLMAAGIGEECSA